MRPTKPAQGEPKYPPLASILRPRTLSDVIGQTHLVGEGAPFRKMVENDRPMSTILWGMPGTGKTSMVSALANELNAHFRPLNATSATVKDIRSVIEEASASDQRTVVFVDECLPYNALVLCKIADSIAELPIGYIVDNRIEALVLSFNEELKEFEWNKISGWSISKPKKVLELRFDDGQILRCSEDHLIYTENRGYVEASLLLPDDVVVSSQKYRQEIHNAKDKDMS